MNIAQHNLHHGESRRRIDGCRSRLRHSRSMRQVIHQAPASDSPMITAADDAIDDAAQTNKRASANSVETVACNTEPAAGADGRRCFDEAEIEA
ncbi:MAG: hypothetical protein M3458_21055 [Acidobacteriota bacterium]|nr:hypothetical protein [Acidobacteriota bacterium]